LRHEVRVSFMVTVEAPSRGQAAMMARQAFEEQFLDVGIQFRQMTVSPATELLDPVPLPRVPSLDEIRDRVDKNRGLI